MGKINWKKGIVIYLVSAVGVFLFSVIFLSTEVVEALEFSVIGGLLVPLVFLPHDPNNIEEQANMYAQKYNTDQATGRIIAELEKQNRAINENDNQNQ